ncbi:hypothetical protein F9K88_04205 [Brucella intermedia]|uniref:hypothetical protein n=1 Tax=Brucella TaxID=234 RepID=UPI000AB85E99|nr:MULTISPECIES: hypothetical protein [Brucella/Ochrobactrum group]KAB2714791.1 hypothetical protein F9K88_04205 [Brucella intermedia]MBA8843100.1 hypothetical protein [Ochrobactrum sp. RH1CCR137]MBA8855288.1 hypothetical protein [Ochrobactrum sp. RH1CCR134]MDL2203961.1 hypothetical protein [Brucella intermedia]QNQ39855.1 hypothetical protein IAR37_10905 [Brucella intermedia]
MNIHPKHRYKQRNPKDQPIPLPFQAYISSPPCERQSRRSLNPHVSHATNSQKFQKLLKIEQMTLHCRQLFMMAGCGFNDGSAMHKEKIGY